jgi:hypothetical protein
VAVPRPKETVPVHEKRTISDAWLKRTVQAYPKRTAEMLLAQGDQFRNPAGYALREGLPVLLDAVLGDGELAAAGLVLEELLRIRAVQEFSASEAVSFIFFLKPLLRGRSGHDDRIDERIDELALMAFDAYMRCRERLLALQANESRRKTYLLERMLES